MPKIGEKNNFDVRLVAMSIQRGFYSEEAQQKYLKNLKDDADNAIWVDVEADENEGVDASVEEEFSQTE